MPPGLRRDCALDPFYTACCLADDGECIINRRIEWHHGLIVAGRQLQKKFCILPACDGYHHKYANRRDIAMRFMKIALNRATDQELLDISKGVDYFRLRGTLNNESSFAILSTV